MIRHTTPAGQSSQEYHDRLILRSGPFTGAEASRLAVRRQMDNPTWRQVIVSWGDAVYVDRVKNFGGIGK